jgi:hypothetical protein
VRFVLAHSPLNVAGDPDIEHPALTTHDVHVVCLFHTNILGANGRGCLCRASHLQLWISRFEPTPSFQNLIVIPSLRSEGTQGRDLTMPVKALGSLQDGRRCLHSTNSLNSVLIYARGDPTAS